MATDDINAFVAAHPTHPGFTADRMIDVREGIASIAEVEAIATDAEDPGEPRGRVLRARRPHLTQRETR